MPDPIITNNKNFGVVVWEPVFENEKVTFAGAATLLAGTIMARDSVSGFLVPFVVGGVTNENGIPKAILKDALTATVAGDLPVRAIIAGRVRENQLIIDADQDNSNVNKGVLDDLRDYTMIGLESTPLNILDNQP